ncbi:PilZ domain-containing protein [Bdellovibrio sp. HCB2-146]|uniref:PilZ domain-containing protein n=1 Tax=Bdellovibrio sp. HCB2-146 TaxID=3394362 RepID=UPI0039BCA609
MAEELTLFKCINSVSERQRLFTTLLSSQGNLYLKDKFDRSLPLKAKSVDSRFYLTCISPAESEFTFGENETFTAVFWIDQEKYLFETRPHFVDGNLVLPVMTLFHLQKRRTFRYQVPHDFGSRFNISHLNKNTINVTCRMIDLSTQGCAVEVDQSAANLHLEDIMEAEICLGGRDPIIVQGVIKNIRAKDFQNLILGIEFHHMVHSSEEQIMLAISDLQRELFSRRAA